MKMSKKVIYLVCYLAIFALAFLMLGEDAISFIKWWLVLAVLGIVALPMTTYLFRGFHDVGYLFAKPIGIALSGYLLWMLSTMKLLKFTPMNGTICVILFLIPNVYMVYRSKKKNTMPSWITKEKIEHFLKEELVFLFVFLIWCYIKGFKAQAYGTEKFMDYGFMTSMMRSDYMPPYDLWYSGGVINYYYFGQYLATFLTKISHVSVNVGYNLMLMTIASLSMVLPYSIVTNVSKQMLCKKKANHKQWIAPLSGILGGLILSCSSNLHFPIFRWIVPAVQGMLGIEVSSYWFPDATRYIGYQPDTPDKTIHEFPAYSTVLGDLHAHYINMIFVITVIALLFAWYMRQEQIREDKKLTMPVALTKKDYMKEVFEPGILLITFFIGMFHMTNFWDFPIYFVVSGAVILFSNARKYQFKIQTFIVTFFQGIFVFIGSEIVALPFTLQFDQISTEILLSEKHTPFYQLLILWGLPCIILIGFMGNVISKYNKEYPKRVGNPIAHFMMQIDFQDLFILTLGLCALGLVLMPEVIYVKDIYSSEYKRANTMFKLTYQSFIMFSMCSGYILIRSLFFGSSNRQKRNAICGIVLSVLTISYMGHSINAWFGNVFLLEQRKGLDAAVFMEEEMPDDAKAIAWLNENVTGHAVVLEANGDSYSDYERISVMTGLQTVAGWYVHEWLWRGDSVELTQRNDDIKTIYTSNDFDMVQTLVEKYDIDYIYVGTLEYEKFTDISTEVLMELGQVVYEEASTEQSGKMIYIIQVERS